MPSDENLKRFIDSLLDKMVQVSRRHLEPPEDIRGESKPPPLIPPHCIFMRCIRPHAGPRFSYLCRQHADTLTTPERKKLLINYRGPRVPQRGKSDRHT